MKPDKSELLSLILRPSGRKEPPLPLPAALRNKARSRQDFEDWYETLKEFLPDEEDGELAEYFQFALMGLVVAFGDRHLSPYLPAHTAIIPPLLEDIRAVYGQIRDSGAEYNREEFIFRAFDYGIHKAYYLDWSLYISKDMY